ncbi:MAG: EAL domain-containing protein [Campylobacterota bacterium]|nr:EAL domain-containing protein [Campylobacterota bacterium]
MSGSMGKLLSLSENLKLLYVEDDKTARETTLKLFENFFKDITVAVDGQDGIEKFKEQKFDLVISDINMPNLNGLDMAKLIKEIRSDMPILMLSAHNDSEYFLKAIELDVDGYILKPLSLGQFSKSLFKIAQNIKFSNISKNYQLELENEVKKRNAELEHKLHYDDLTNLLSRYSFFNDIQKLNAPVILLIDIDKFRTINEVYGSSIGSKVLSKFAQTLSSIIKDEVYKIYRLSADEFAIVDTTKHIEPEKYEILIEELFIHLNHLEIIIDENIISVDITIGLSTVDENGYESAKIALDYAKQHKKPFIMYSTAIDYRKESSLTLKCIDDISLAIRDDRVVAVYQPIVDKQGEIIKHETLMRLQDIDSSNLISPFYFLDVAIKTRLYEPLSSVVIFKALNMLATTNHTLSMNFTYSDINNSEFIRKVENFLILHEGVGRRTVFEITESESIENYDEVKGFIKRFRKYGVKIAIDDFGSGFSNFEYILEIEPDYLKIDGSLVKDIDKDTRAHTLVEAIVQFSHKLGIKIIAEYVHSEVIFNMLKELDVDEYQGFYFSKPLENI